MREPGAIAISHKTTHLKTKVFTIKTVELPLPMEGGQFQNVVYGQVGWAAVHHTRHETLLEALAMHPHVVDDYAAHPRVVTGPAKKGKVA